jgi:hypothetical protein
MGDALAEGVAGADGVTVGVGSTTATLAAGLGDGEAAGAPPFRAKKAAPITTSATTPATSATTGTFRPGGGAGGGATGRAWSSSPQ